jgi:hypothetical protein
VRNRKQAIRDEDLPLYPWWVELVGILAFLVLTAWVGFAAGNA